MLEPLPSVPELPDEPGNTSHSFKRNAERVVVHDDSEIGLRRQDVGVNEIRNDGDGLTTRKIFGIPSVIR